MASSTLLALVCCALIVGLCVAARVQYTGYHVVQIKEVNSDRQASFIHKILDKDTRDRKIFLLEDSVLAGHPATIIVHPDLVDAVVIALRRHELDVSVVNTDLQQSIDENEVINDEAHARWVERRAAGDRTAPDTYLHYDEIEQYLRDVNAAYPGMTSLFDVGPTFEGQTIRGIKIDTDQGSNPDKPAIWLDSGIHAREWIAPATGLYILDRLVSSMGVDAAHLRSLYVWYIIPSANPDGYRYTYSDPGDRMWRKTRSIVEGQACIGTDPNRNWNHTAWGTGSSDFPCGQTYHGPAPFSEIEVLSCANYIFSLRDSLVMTIHMHAYTQLWLHAYGWTTTPSDNHDNVVAVAEAACTGAFEVNGLVFRATSPAEEFGPSTGSVMDWVYDTAGISYTYGPEMRPLTAEQGGFEIPPSNIEPSGQEIFNAIYKSVQEYERITLGTK